MRISDWSSDVCSSDLQWNHMGRRQEIKQFILGNFLFTDDDSAFTDDTSLIPQGIVDSPGILELIVFIEETWPVRVPAEDMPPAHFDSLGATARYRSEERGVGKGGVSTWKSRRTPV